MEMLGPALLYDPSSLEPFAVIRHVRLHRCAARAAARPALSGSLLQDADVLVLSERHTASLNASAPISYRWNRDQKELLNSFEMIEVGPMQAPLIPWPPLTLSPHLVRGLVLPQPDVNRVAKEIVGRPGQIGDLGDKLRLDPVDAGENERRSEARLSRRQDVSGGFVRASGSSRRRRSARTLSGIPVPTRPA